MLREAPTWRACDSALGAPERVRSMSARLTAPSFPGETIRLELRTEGNRVRFRAFALERRMLVLDRGDCLLAPA
jgi:hypothetical protein